MDHLIVSEKKRQKSCGRIVENCRACLGLVLGLFWQARACHYGNHAAPNSAMIPFATIQMDDRCIPQRMLGTPKIYSHLCGSECAVDRDS
jgi:hypothetical protein